MNLNIVATGISRYLDDRNDFRVAPPLQFRADTHWERYPPFASTVASTFSWLLAEKLALIHPIDAHHAGVVLFGALAVWATHALALELTGSFVVGVIAAFTLFFFPQFFDHSHNNVKDIPLTALFVTALLYIVRAVRVGRMRDVLTASVVTGIAGATKYNAVFLFPIALLLMVCVKGKTIMNQRSSHVGKGVIFLCISVISLFLAWPWVAIHPADSLRLIYQYVSTVGRNLSVLFDGKTYGAGFDVPWYYAPAMLAVVTPLPALAFCIVGICTSVGFGFAKDAHTRAKALPLLWISVVLVRYLLPSTVVYNGIRHFFEVAPALSVLTAYGIVWVGNWLARRIGRGKRQIIILCLALFVIGHEIYVTVVMHPYQAVYFNEIVGGPKYASERFEFDYWGFSVKELVQWVNTHESNRKKTLTVNWIGFSSKYFPGNSFDLITSGSATDYVIIPHSNNFFSGAQSYWRERGTLLYAVQRMGADIGYLYATGIR